MSIIENCFAEYCFTADCDSCSDDSAPKVPDNEHMTDIYSNKI
jgi:hypothetical protein